MAWSLCFLGETLSHSAPPFSLPPSWGGRSCCLCTVFLGWDSHTVLSPPWGRSCGWSLCFLGETLTQCTHTPPCGAEAVACALCFLGETLSHSAPKGIKIFSLERRETWWKFGVPRNPKCNSIRLLKITSVFERWGLFVLDQFPSRRHRNAWTLHTLIPGTCFSKIPVA